MLVLAGAAAVLCAFAWRRFSALLMRAEAPAGKATCAQCRAYAKFDVVAVRNAPDAAGAEVVSVRYRKCCGECALT